MNYYEANCGHNSFGSGPTNPTITYDWQGSGPATQLASGEKVRLQLALKITLYFDFDETDKNQSLIHDPGQCSPSTVIITLRQLPTVAFDHGPTTYSDDKNRHIIHV